MKADLRNFATSKMEFFVILVIESSGVLDTPLITKKKERANKNII